MATSIIGTDRTGFVAYKPKVTCTCKNPECYGGGHAHKSGLPPEPCTSDDNVKNGLCYCCRFIQASTLKGN